MCDPVTATIVVATTLAAAGSITAGVGAFKQGQFQNEMAQSNAQLARFQADDAINRGNLAEAESRRRTEQLKGSQQSALAANNVVLGEGSALDILQSTAELGELDALTIRNNAEREAAGFSFSGASQIAGGKLAAQQGRTALTASVLNTGGSVISGASQVLKVQEQRKIAGIT